MRISKIGKDTLGTFYTRIFIFRINIVPFKIREPGEQEEKKGIIFIKLRLF